MPVHAARTCTPSACSPSATSRADEDETHRYIRAAAWGDVRLRLRLRLLLSVLAAVAAVMGVTAQGSTAHAEPPKADEAATGAPTERPADDELDRLLDQASSEASLGGWEDPEVQVAPSWPRLEHHGYFRFRADLFWNGHLSTVIPGEQNTGTSAIPAPLTENYLNNSPDLSAWGGTTGSDDDKTIASANIRLRYSPTLHITPTIRLHATFDILDNLVLGSTPDFAGNLVRPDVSLVAFSQAQQSPTAGFNGFQDAIRVKEAYAEWQPSFLLRVGRMQQNWGLGILANAGNEIDDDFGDFTDRALLLVKFFGVYVAAAWDFVYSGATTADPADFFGQPKDLGQADDVKQWVVSFFQKPMSAREKRERQIQLYEEFAPAIDWGVWAVARLQDLDLSNESYVGGNGVPGYADAGGTATYDALELVPRQAWAVIPDLWFKYEQRFNQELGVRVELELVGLFGAIDNVTDDGPDLDDREIFQMAGALEFQVDWTGLTVGLDTGAASGDSAEGFGVRDQHTLANPDGTPNRRLTNFKFDRDYQVDIILFREVIGTVTNAAYVKPYVSYDFFESPDDALGARLDLLLAWALEPEATPGNERFLGFEADLRLFYEEKGLFNLDIEAGFLVPGGAFNLLDAGTGEVRAEADFAFSIQSRLTFQF